VRAASALAGWLVARRAPAAADSEKINAFWPAVDTRSMLDRVMQMAEGMMFRCAIDGEWTMHLVSDGCLELTGYTPAELVGNRAVSYEDITHAEDRQAVRETILAAVAEGVRYRVSYRIRCRDGVEKWVLERGCRICDERGQWVLEGFVEDISERVHSRDALAEAEARYRSIFEHSTEGIFQTTADGRYLSANPALAAIYGYESAAELIGDLQNIGAQLYVDPQRREAFKRIMAESGAVHGFEAQIRRRDGSVIWISENARSVLGPDGEFLYYEGAVQDITANKQYQEQLEHQASHDLLTGLPNRNLLNDRLQQAISHAERNGYFAVVAFIDLDNFKYINDSLGHLVGDELLVEIARRLQFCLRSTDTVARYGGDEFVLVLNNHYAVGSIVHVLDRVLTEIQRPVLAAGQELFVTCSIGLSLYPSDGGDAQSLIKNADAAMYLAKSRGRNNYQFFTHRLNTLATERVTFEGSLRRALEREELHVYFQPKIGKDRRPLGFEALIRWNSAEHGWVPPDKFIGIAEETGLIEPITEFVLNTACLQAVTWSRAGYGDLNMAVNLSARSLQQTDVTALVAKVLSQTGLDPQRLEIEITESMIIGNVDRSLATLHKLKALGVRLAVDDFGTGYSSLSYLQRFPVDILKIDRSFVRDLDVVACDSHIAKLVVLLGHSLGLIVVAEGVETESQYEYLEALGCDEYQGFLFARPLAPGDIETQILRLPAVTV